MKSGENWSSSLRERCSKMLHDFKCVILPRTGPITPRGQNVDCTCNKKVLLL